MAFGTTPKGSDTIPLSSGYVENDAIYAVRGLAKHTDGSSNTSVAVEVASASGDIATGAIVDLATLLALAGTSGDANTVASIMGRLTKIRDLLNGTLTISGSVTETNSASIKTDLDTIAGAVSSAKVQANVSQINGVAPSMGNGISGTGVQRVTIASDSTGQVTLAAGAAVIGHVINDASSAVIGHVIADSGSTTAVTSLPSIPTGGNIIGAVIQASGPWTQNLTQVNSSALSNTNPVPTQDIEQSGYTSASTPPSATNVGTDTTYTFSSQVSRVILQNNTSANVNYAFDATSTSGSLLLLPGAMLVYPKKCTVVHLFTAAAQNINGSSAGNIVVLGAN
jgi:hypothetical protein